MYERNYIRNILGGAYLKKIIFAFCLLLLVGCAYLLYETHQEKKFLQAQIALSARTAMLEATEHIAFITDDTHSYEEKVSHMHALILASYFLRDGNNLSFYEKGIELNKLATDYIETPNNHEQTEQQLAQIAAFYTQFEAQYNSDYQKLYKAIFETSTK